MRNVKEEIIYKIRLFDSAIENSKTLDEKLDYIIISLKRMFYSERAVDSRDMVCNPVKKLYDKIDC